MPSIIIAVNINLHPASHGNITPIILSYDRDNGAREGSRDRASYFLAAYYKGLFGAWWWINHFNMALVEGAIRRCSLRLIKSKTPSPSLASIRMGGGAEGEDETLNISGLCLPAATVQVSSSYCHICLQQLCGVSGPAVCVCVCYWSSTQTRKHHCWHKELGQRVAKILSKQRLLQHNQNLTCVQKSLQVIPLGGHTGHQSLLWPSWWSCAAVMMFPEQDTNWTTTKTKLKVKEYEGTHFHWTKSSMARKYVYWKDMQKL